MYNPVVNVYEDAAWIRKHLFYAGDTQCTEPRYVIEHCNHLFEFRYSCFSFIFCSLDMKAPHWTIRTGVVDVGKLVLPALIAGAKLRRIFNKTKNLDGRISLDLIQHHPRSTDLIHHAYMVIVPSVKKALNKFILHRSIRENHEWHKATSLEGEHPIKNAEVWRLEAQENTGNSQC